MPKNGVEKCNIEKKICKQYAVLYLLLLHTLYDTITLRFLGTDE
jgi:hypothetical protein